MPAFSLELELDAELSLDELLSEEPEESVVEDPSDEDPVAVEEPDPDAERLSVL